MLSLDEELKQKRDGKYSIEREQQAREWIQSVIGEELVGDSFHEQLKNGVSLCKIINAIVPGAALKPSPSKLGFKQMENIHLFLVAVEKDLGVRAFETFQTVDLYEEKNMVQVIDCIFAVSRCAERNGFKGPRLGPKMATANERKFTEAQLLEAKHAVPLQTGFTKGASQKGMAFGGFRQIGGKYEGGFGGSKEVELDTAPINGFEKFGASPKAKTSSEPALESPETPVIEAEQDNQSELIAATEIPVGGDEPESAEVEDEKAPAVEEDLASPSIEEKEVSATPLSVSEAIEKQLEDLELLSPVEAE